MTKREYEERENIILSESKALKVKVQKFLKNKFSIEIDIDTELKSKDSPLESKDSGLKSVPSFEKHMEEKEIVTTIINLLDHPKFPVGRMNKNLLKSTPKLHQFTQSL